MTTSQAGGRRPVFRWIVVAFVALVIAAAVLLPLVNMSRYHRMIADSVGQSLGRPVHLGSVQLQVFPRPGLAISDFIVEETAAFGAEPILRSPSVLVSFRFLSLWRGRLEVSRIDLDSASVNLVHSDRGDWNIGSLLLDASRNNRQAPTGQRHASDAPRFPYIEFHSARINLKDGNQKKPFSFLNTDLSIWLDKPTQWSLRMEAQPARTDLDLDLSDAGLVKIEGTINRATSINQMPVNLHAEWTGAQIGQVSRLLLGDDSGWRGDLQAEARLSGLLDALNVQTRLRVDGVHREEFTPDTPMNIDARCRGIYKHSNRSLDDLTCLWPVGDGHLLLTGSILNFAQPQNHLALELNHIPANFAVSALGLLHRGLTTLPKATGTVNGGFSVNTGDASPAFTGHAEVSGLALALAGVDTPLGFPTLEFSTPAAAIAPVLNGKRGGQKNAHPAVEAQNAAFTLLLQPAPLDLGAPKPLTIFGQFGKNGFSIHASGQSSLARLASFGRLMGHSGAVLTGLTADTTTAAATPAEIDLTLTAPWITPVSITPVASGQPQTSATTLGWLRLSHALAKPAWLPEPIHIASATANFTPETIAWNNLNFSIQSIAARGNVSYPLQCAPDAECPARFSLDAATVDAAAMQSALLGTGGHGELVNAILSEVKQPSAPWPAAEGTVTIGRLMLAKLQLMNVRSTLTLGQNQAQNQVQIVSLDGSALGGSLHAGGRADMASGQPRYALNLTWTDVDPAKAAAIFGEKWGSGNLSGDAHLELSGFSVPDLAHAAHGNFHWSWTNGAVTNGSLTKESSDPDDLAFSPQHFAQWTAAGTIIDEALHLNGSGGVKGDIGFDRSLDLTWATATGSLRVQGSLGQPTIAQSTGTAGK